MAFSNSNEGKSPSSDESRFLEDATQYLESPSFLLKLADKFGKPLALLTQGIEKIAPAVVENAVGEALRAAMTIAARTIPTNSASDDIAIGGQIGDVGMTTDFWHKVSVAVTGSAGGFFGLLGLPIELPVTTTIMFRSIASTANDFGENLADNEVRLQCISVFSLGGPRTADDEMASAYLSGRLATEKMISMAAKAVAGKTTEQITKMIQKGTAPAVVDLIARIATRFNVTVTEKLVAQTLPVVGAAAGGAVNVAFMDHFNRVARFHFGIRSLERKYGKDYIQSLFMEAVQRRKK